MAEPSNNEHDSGSTQGTPNELKGADATETDATSVVADSGTPEAQVRHSNPKKKKKKIGKGSSRTKGGGNDAESICEQHHSAEKQKVESYAKALEELREELETQQKQKQGVLLALERKKAEVQRLRETAASLDAWKDKVTSGIHLAAGTKEQLWSIDLLTC